MKFLSFNKQSKTKPVRRKASIVFALALIMVLGTMPFTANASNQAAQITQEGGVDIMPFATPNAIALANTINGIDHGGSGTLYAAVSGSVVIVTGTVTGATQHLSISIPADVTVRWQATFRNTNVDRDAVRISGSGNFEMISGEISNYSGINTLYGALSVLTGEPKITMSGGTISSTGNGYAIYFSSPARLNEILNFLEERGYLRVEKNSTGGRPADYIKVNPAVLGDRPPQ